MSSDGQRLYPVNRLILHHSVGPEFKGASEQTVADWFNAIGRNRGYAGIAKSFHFDPRTGKETFAQAHYALFETPGTKYGWSLVELIKDPQDNVAWGAGVWPINQQSINIEICGTFTDKLLPDGALLLLADFWRPIDQKLKGKTFINGHKDFSPTICPGRIKDQIPVIVDLINNPPVVKPVVEAPVVVVEPPKPIETTLPQPVPTPTPTEPTDSIDYSLLGKGVILMISKVVAFFEGKKTYISAFVLAAVVVAEKLGFIDAATARTLEGLAAAVGLASLRQAVK